MEEPQEDVAEEPEMAEEAAEDNDPLAGIDFEHPSDDEFDMVDAEPQVEEVVEQEQEADCGVEDILGDEKDPLVDGIAETATIGAMAKLAENISLARTSDGVTLEDIVRELLRPMLKDWLDDNLPTIIERLVSEELERLTEKAMRK